MLNFKSETRFKIFVKSYTGQLVFCAILKLVCLVTFGILAAFGQFYVQKLMVILQYGVFIEM